MIRTVTLTTSIGLALVLTACALAPGDESAGPLPSDAAVVEDCGDEDTMHGTSYNVAGRECLLAAFEAGRPATFVSNAVTVEGAPVSTTYRVLGPELVEVAYDNREDPLGSGRIDFYRCPRLVPVDEFNRVQGAGLPGEQVFIEDGCEPIGG